MKTFRPSYRLFKIESGCIDIKGLRRESPFNAMQNQQAVFKKKTVTFSHVSLVSVDLCCLGMFQPIFMRIYHF